MVLRMLNALLHSSFWEPGVHGREDHGVLMAGMLCVHQLEYPELGGKGFYRSGKGCSHSIAGSLQAGNTLTYTL